MANDPLPLAQRAPRVAALERELDELHRVESTARRLHRPRRAGRQGSGQSFARRLINEDAAGILPVFVRREPGGASSCFRVWHRVDGTHTSPAVLCFRSRWPAGPGSIDAAGVALSRKGAKSRTGGRKLVMLMARPIPRADLKKQESRWACRRSGSSHVSVGLTGLLNPT